MRSGGEIRLGARNGKHVLFRTTLAPESSTLPIQATVSFFTDFFFSEFKLLLHYERKSERAK